MYEIQNKQTKIQHPRTQHLQCLTSNKKLPGMQRRRKMQGEKLISRNRLRENTDDRMMTVALRQLL